MGYNMSDPRNFAFDLYQQDPMVLWRNTGVESWEPCENGAGQLARRRGL